MALTQSGRVALGNLLLSLRVPISVLCGSWPSWALSAVRFSLNRISSERWTPSTLPQRCCPWCHGVCAGALASSATALKVPVLAALLGAGGSARKYSAAIPVGTERRAGRQAGGEQWYSKHSAFLVHCPSPSIKPLALICPDSFESPVPSICFRK